MTDPRAPRGTDHWYPARGDQGPVPSLIDDDGDPATTDVVDDGAE